MHPFRPDGGATLRFRTDFAGDPNANIFFYDAARAVIPFHLSLRAGEALAVVNQRDAAGWRRELPHPVTFDTCHDVCIEFGPAGATVWLDGARLGRFGRLPRPDPGGPRLMRRGFRALDRIAHVAFEGAVAADSIEITGAANAPPPGGALVLDDRLEIRARGFAPEGAVLEVPGLADPPALLPVTLPYRAPGGFARETGLRAVLPGRLWQGAGEAVPVRLMRGGAELARLELTRAGIAEHVARILETDDLRADPFAAMQVIEHVRFAGLGERLPEAARRALADIAAFYGLDAPLPAGDTAPLATPAADPDMQAVNAARDHFTAAMRADPDADPVAQLERVLARPDLSQEARRGVALALTEYFCANERFEALFERAAQAGLADFEPGGDDVWYNSAILPFLMMQGRLETVREVILELSAPQPGWIVTPAIAWAMRHALGPGAQDEYTREKLLYAGMRFIDHQARDHFARSPCSALTDAAVRLTGYAVRAAPDYMRHHVTGFVLRCYGLSRSFWARIDAAGIALSPALAAARTAFGVLAGDGDGDVDAALALFERAGNPEAARWRRELLGPAGIAGTPDPEMIARAGRDPGEAALRYLAFPGSDATPALACAAAEALPARYEQVPRAPYARLQAATGRRAAAMAARVAAGGWAPDPGEIAGLAGDLALLAGPRSGFVGLGAGLALMGGLERAGAREAALELLDALAAIAAAQDPDHAAARDAAPALRSALWALRETGPLPLAGEALERFAGAAADLPAPSGAAPWPRANPVFDTLVVVFSCRANLDTRIPALRAGWLGLLARVGVPYVVVVGDGDGSRDGDIVHLDAPDDYEGLPDKTLAAIRWVHDNTRFVHLYKIDDDCFLDPPAFFHDLGHRKADYYGRPLTRVPGQMDRAWHMGKSTSPRGRLEFDKSPEPSRYADGGSGYALSRAAMAAVLDAAASPQGRHLRGVSFMEDKLVGDLLALRGITVSDEDYRISIRRRTHPGAAPVSLWVNSFDASRAAPVKMIHLDTHEGQDAALARLDADTLTPKKIWPSYSPVTLGYQSNALELVSDAAALARAREAGVAVVAAMRNEMFMIGHFLDHYRRLGVGAFLIADNLSDDGTREYLAAQPDVALFCVDTDYSHSQYGVAWQQALMANVRVGRWSLVADADELLVWQHPQRQTLPELLAGADFADAEAARVFMLDMYPEGPLEQADFASGDPFGEAGFVDRYPFRADWPGRGPYSDAPTWTSALRHRLIPGSRSDLFVAQKIALLRYRPWMRLSAGLHFVADARLAERELIFAHFKYNADFRRKARAEVTRRQHFNDAEEYRKYLALASEGRDVIFDPEISVPWTACDFVRRRLG